jgi:hypothetical protein
VIYNHPTHKRDSSIDIVEELRHWRQKNSVVIGIQGAAGDQDSNPTGGYQRSLPTIDRWDPAVAAVSDAWYQLLQAGLPLWGALSTSDFHNADVLLPTQV